MKNVSKSEFVGGHVGAILFHALLGIFIIWIAWKLSKVRDEKYIYWIYYASGLNVLISLLGLIPVLSNTEYNIS